MKRAKTFLTIISLVVAGCGENKQSTSDFITVDVTKSYQTKDLILQDFMDVEYIALETTDEFINEGIVLAVGNEIILIGNRSDMGDIFVYDRTGKGLRKINRSGRGPGEYMAISGIVLDEENGELFLIDPFSGIIVYDIYGNFRRSFNPKDRTRFEHAYNYGNDHLICLGAPPFGRNSVSTASSFLIVSKHDGSINNEIHIPFVKGKVPTGVQIRTDDGTWIMTVMTSFFHSLIPYHSDWMLTEASSDTVYRYLQNNIIRPFIVRTPPRQTMSQETLLFPGILTDRYYFMIVLKEDNGAESPWPTMSGTPVMTTTSLVYDQQERIISEPTVYNGDFSDKRQVSMFQKTADNSKIAFWLKIEAHELINDFKKGVLNGKLKEIAAKLNEDDNPIIMLVKYKN